MYTNRLIAIIPARGGSKGLLRKNIKLLDGKPLIAYTIEAALNAKSISRVIVSTEDEEIAKISRDYGAEVPFMRPVELATDCSLSIDVYEFVITKLENEENIQVSEFVVLQPTSPLRTSVDIDKAVELYFKKKAFSVISYCQEYHPISWHKYIDADLKLETIFKNDLSNRQDIKTTYFPNGSIYVLCNKVFETRNYYDINSFAYVMEKSKSVDIDTIEDFELAEMLIKKITTSEEY